MFLINIMNFIEPFFTIPKYPGFSEYYYVCEIYQKYRIFHAILLEKQIEQLELDEILKVKLNDGYDIGRFIKIVKYKSKDVNSLNESDNNNLYFCKPIDSENELNEIKINTKIYNKLSKDIFNFVNKDKPKHVKIEGVYIQYDYTKVYIYYTLIKNSKFWDFKEFINKNYPIIKKMGNFDKLRIFIARLS